MLKEGMLSTFLVAYTFFLGVNLKKGIADFCFCIFVKIFLVFSTNVATEGILKLILEKTVL